MDDQKNQIERYPNKIGMEIDEQEKSIEKQKEIMIKNRETLEKVFDEQEKKIKGKKKELRKRRKIIDKEFEDQKKEIEEREKQVEEKKKQLFVNHLKNQRLRYDLADTFTEIEKNDTNYEKRYPLVLKAFYLSAELGYPTFLKPDPDDKEFYIVYITLPVQGVGNQVSWHMPMNTGTWNGHTTDEKYNTCFHYKFSHGRPIMGNFDYKTNQYK